MSSLLPPSSLVPSSSSTELATLAEASAGATTATPSAPTDSHWRLVDSQSDAHTDLGTDVDKNTNIEATSVPHTAGSLSNVTAPSTSTGLGLELGLGLDSSLLSPAHERALVHVEREESIRMAVHHEASQSSVVGDRGDLHADDAAVMTWKDLTLTTRTQPPRSILNHVSGALPAGHLVAIMGPSGSGKSTLLNALAHRLDRNTMKSGTVHLFGRPYTTAQLKAVSGYVMQDDLLNGHLTVEETLIYTAHLRLSPDLTIEEKEQRVDQVIKQLGLQGCRHTIVGSPLRKGISGGQRKRVCVAMELLPRPAILFLDEPTSGLDSVTALSLITLLKELTETVTHDGHRFTVVCTIHQPQSRIFDLFDDLVILKAGSVVFGGSCAAALNAWRKAGLPVPDGANPADHLLETISPPIEPTTGLPKPQSDGGSSAEERIKLALRGRKPTGEFMMQIDNETPEVKIRQRLPWHGQFHTLLLRHIREQSRRRGLLLVQTIQTVIMAVLIGTSFFRIGTNQTSLVRRQPVLFFCCINQGVFGSLSVINSFPAERLLTLRERAAGTYNVSAYFMAKVAAETLVGLINPTIFGAVVYFLIGLQPVAGKFFEFIAFMILCSLSANSLALFISALCRTTNVAVNVLPLTMELARLYGGFFLSPRNLPHYFVWLDAISYVKYAYTGISLSELSGLGLSCDGLKNGTKCITNGEFIIEDLGLNYLSSGDCAGILIAYIIGMRFLAYLAVRFIKW